MEKCRQLTTKQLFWWAFVLLFVQSWLLPAQEVGKFSFDPMSEWKYIEKENAYISTGKHSLPPDTHVWLFLRDRYENHYLQYPPVELFDDGTWEATNVVLGDNIHRLQAVLVNDEGHSQLVSMAKKMESEQNWRALEQSVLENLPGYRALQSVRLNNKKRDVPLPIDSSKSTQIEKPKVKSSQRTEVPEREKTTAPNKKSDKSASPAQSESLLIADFESGKDPINSGGVIQKWHHGNDVQVEAGYHKLQDDGTHGNYAGSVVLKYPKNSKEDWSGGGLVMVFRDSVKSLNVRSFDFLQFDVQILPGSQLANTKIKLEDSKGSKRAERPLSEFGITLSTEWQTVKIPLEVFTKLRNVDPEDWRGLDRTSVTKLVTVSVRDAKYPDTSGTLLIDNVRFVKRQ